MKQQPGVCYAVPESLTEEQIAEAKRCLDELAGLFGRISDKAWRLIQRAAY